MQQSGNNAEIKLFTGSSCPYCRHVQRELDRLGLEYESVNADADGRDTVVKLSGQHAVPIVTIGEDVIVDSQRIIRELRHRYAA